MTPFFFTAVVLTEQTSCPPFLPFLDGLKLIVSLDHSVGHRRGRVSAGMATADHGGGEKVTVNFPHLLLVRETNQNAVTVDSNATRYKN